MDKDEDIRQLKNRFRDLAERANRKNVYTFTGFLGLGEQDVFHMVHKEMAAKYCAFGGYEHADRKVIRFGNADELGYEEEFPIVCLKVLPVQEKFSDALTHRDYLGALMNLGIDRSKVGDILVGDKQAYVFCLEGIAEYICEHLEQIRHTRVRVAVTEHADDIPKSEPVEEELLVASGRIDACIAKLWNLSRGDCVELFRAGKVYVNGHLCENNAHALKPGETVNARGFGKFIYVGEPRESRKGKWYVKVKVFR